MRTLKPSMCLWKRGSAFRLAEDVSSRAKELKSVTQRIQLGLVTDTVPLEDIADGWDFLEIPLQFHIVPMENEETWRVHRDRYLKRGIPTPVASHYIPGIRKGTGAAGPAYDREQQLFWAARSFRRMHEIGVKVAGVYGAFFRCPDGYPIAKAWDDALSFCNILADEGEKYGIDIALEPMADPDTLFPSYAEGLAFAKRTGRRAIKMMVDLNYFLKLNESLDIIREDPEYCVHVQMAGGGHGHSQTNLEPHEKQYRELFSILKDIGYDRTVSVAAPWYSTTGASEIDYAYETSTTLTYMQKLRAEFWD